MHRRGPVLLLSPSGRQPLPSTYLPLPSLASLPITHSPPPPPTRLLPLPLPPSLPLLPIPIHLQCVLCLYPHLPVYTPLLVSPHSSQHLLLLPPSTHLASIRPTADGIKREKEIGGKKIEKKRNLQQYAKKHPGKCRLPRQQQGYIQALMEIIVVCGGLNNSTENWGGIARLGCLG